MKAPFWEDVSSEIAILGPQEGVLNLLSTGRKAPLFLRGRGVVLLSVIPSLPSPLPLALYLIQLVLLFIHALFVCMFVPPGSLGGFSWIHLEAYWELLELS